MAAAKDVRAEQMLTVPQVAARLVIGRTTVYELIAAGKLPIHDIGSGKSTRIRVSESDLAAYIASTKVRPLSRGRAA